MKKFKKSAVVIPALARIAVTAAASVSGTVAWFTANRSVTVKGSNFNAVAQDGDLSIELGNVLVGVVADDKGNTGSVKMADKTSLTDASYDPKESKLYTKILGENEKNETVVTGYEDLGIATEAGGVGGTQGNHKWSYVNGSGASKTTVYYGVSWTWNFTYAFKSDANDMGLFFNIKDSTIGITNKDSDNNKKNRNGTEYKDSNKEVGKGFRLAREAETDTDNKNEHQTIVWAPKGGQNSHVTGPTTTAAFDAGIFHTVEETGASTATDLGTDYNANNNGYCFLGRLTSTVATISVKCTAWFEGTDINVANEALNQVVTTTQRFYVRKLIKKITA